MENGDVALSLMPKDAASSIDGGSASASSADCGKRSIEEAPILILLLFQKAMRSELDWLSSEAMAFAMGSGGDFDSFSKRFRFLLSVYKHHCNAEDEVIFSALDMRVKNVAQTYSLEHQGEKALFGQLFELLNSGVRNDILRRELASCTRAIKTSLCQHMSKEEKQVFPLLMDKFTFEEQADLVWHFICSIPVNLLAEFLPWLSSFISPVEHHDIMKCLCKIAPEENLLRQVISSWMEGMNDGNLDESPFQDCVSSETEDVWACQHSRSGKRKHVERDYPIDSLTGTHPIDEILHWHDAIMKELNEIFEVAKKTKHPCEAPDFFTSHNRLQFIADIYDFHSLAEDQIIFPALDAELSFMRQHAEEESQANSFRRLIKKILSAGANSSSAEFYSVLSLHANEIVDSIKKHFQNEEAEVLPLVRLRLCPEKQRELMYKSMRIMPLKLLGRAIPWFVATLAEEEAKSFLQNIRRAASTSDTALVTLLSSWASMGHSQGISSSGIFACLSPKSIDSTALEEKIGTTEDCIQVLCSRPCLLATKAESVLLQTGKDKRPFKRCNSLGSFANFNQTASTNTKNFQQLSCDKQPCCASKSEASSSDQRISFLPALKYSHSVSKNPSAPRVDSSLFLKESKIVSLKGCNVARPIDNIFTFHRALCKDLEYLDVESRKLLPFNEASLQQFSGRFRLLCGLHEAHSRAEDDIVFPALESREALHNVSHSYSLDHQQEEKLFADISAVLEELLQLQACFGRVNIKSDATQTDTVSSGPDFKWKKNYDKLATKLQAMSKSLRYSVEQHIFREELELWPLFNEHFSVEEQNKIVGRVIGTTGAEVLQSMLPWVTSSLSLEEQHYMMDTWKQATKNTLFHEWLNEWWTPSSSKAVTETDLIVPKGFEKQESPSLDDETFKPGWKDIFRMNQNELELEIRKVSRDPTLDPRRKAYLIQNLMTSRWIAAQQKSSQVSREEQNDSEDMPQCSPSFRDPDKHIFGCEHYKRNCKLLAACCNKLFTCRFCHDKVSDHSMDRKATTQILCMRCLKVQPVSQTCRTPACNGFQMAKYFCRICKVFDDERTIYHCPFCNLCRVGKGLGIDFFHCMRCNFCLGKKLFDHKCREKSLETNCPICCDFLFTSTEPLRALRCGHFMHSACFQAYTCSHYTCPLCSKSLGDMTVYFGMLDALLDAEELPEEYRDRDQDILCNDCDKKGKARFHWLHHKCSLCGSYNTRVIKTEAK